MPAEELGVSIPIEPSAASVEMGCARAHRGMTGRTTPLYVVCSPCRGVGKTLLSRLLIEFHAIDDRPVAAFDLADEGPQLADFLPQFTTVVDLGDTQGQMALFDRLIADQDAAKIIDLSHRTFLKFFEVVQTIDFFEEARRCSIEPLILFVIAPDPKSAQAYSMLRHQFTAASLMPVRNQTGTIPFPTRDEVSNVSGVPLLDIPSLGGSLKAVVERHSFSFSQFWQATEASLPVLLDDKLSIWMDHVFIQFRDLELWLTCEEASTHSALPGKARARTTRRPRLPGGNSKRDAEAIANDQHPIDVPTQVLKFAPKKTRLMDEGPMDQFGYAIAAMLKKAGALSNNDRTMADELSQQLLAAEDRITQIERELEWFQNRAVRAEAWLQHIQQELEKNLIAPSTATDTNQLPKKH